MNARCGTARAGREKPRKRVEQIHRPEISTRIDLETTPERVDQDFPRRFFRSLLVHEEKYERSLLLAQVTVLRNRLEETDQGFGVGLQNL